MQAVQYEQLVSPGESPTYTDHHRPLQEASPTKSPTPKNVAFELLLDENSKARARIPMRVQIYPHDTTDSIVTTVKNFYGIYNGAAGVSFEDVNGITLIARYENLRNNMTVYVRVMPVQTYEEEYPDAYYGTMPIENHKRPSLGEPFQMASAMQPMPPSDRGHSPTRPASRAARNRSISPSGRSRRSASQHKQLSRPALKSRGSTPHGSTYDDAGYSDSDNGYGSVSGAKKARSEHFASSEISMENILQDGRRKRPKFDSSVSRDYFRYFVFIANIPFFSQGTSSVRPTSSSYYYLDFLHLSTTSLCWPRRSRLAVRTPCPPLTKLLSATIAFSSELRAKRSCLWSHRTEWPIRYTCRS